eukprot:508661-Prymnesium_polylepis.1
MPSPSSPSCPSLCSSLSSAPSPGFGVSPAQRRPSFTPSAPCHASARTPCDASACLSLIHI